MAAPVRVDVILGMVAIVIAAAFAASLYGYNVALRWNIPEPDPPSFTCVQTLTTDDARKLSADLWGRASAGEQTRLVFGCREGVSRLKLERVK